MSDKKTGLLALWAGVVLGLSVPTVIVHSAAATCGDGVTAADEACDNGTATCAAGATNAGATCCEASDCTGGPAGVDLCVCDTQKFPHGCNRDDISGACRCSCMLPTCGDGVTDPGEQCDNGLATCVTGPKVGKPCCVDADCVVGNVLGSCSSSAPGFPNNGNQPNNPCRCTCLVPFCGDGISDNLFAEECDDGTLANGPGKFCNKERRCIGGENGCTDVNGDGGCGSDAAENASRLAATQCTDKTVCVKGTCGRTMCVQNTCGDGIVAGNELCDDGNTVPANGSSDTCGLTAALAASVQQRLKPGCSTTLFENDPRACPLANCLLPLCGDGVTNPGEMCDGGTAACVPPAFNAGALCAKRTDCKNPPGNTADLCQGTALFPDPNRDDVPDRCRSNCMPPMCGDGTSDTGEQCEPPSPGTFCIKNAAGACVLNTCGDSDVCNKSATDAFGATHNCTTGPGGGNEQCDDGNTVDPSPTNADTCFTTCAAIGCGDGVTEVGEQCDSTGMGCSNMREGLNHAEVAPTCCIDGDVVNTNAAIVPGLITVEAAFTALVDCRFPNLISAVSCDASLSRRYTRIRNKALAAQVHLENNDVTGARRILQQVSRQLQLMPLRITRAGKPGKGCEQVVAIANRNANAVHLTTGIIVHLTENNAGFGL